MEVNVSFIKLEYLKAYEYFIDHINAGGSLEKSLLETIDFSKGCFTVILPKNGKIDNIYKFFNGGINPLISTGQVHILEDGRKFIPGRRITTSVETSSIIKKFLDEDESHFMICENVMMSREDNHTNNQSIGLHFFNDEVYYSLSSTNSIDEINITIRRTDHIWHSLVVLYKGSKPHKNLSVANLSDIASGVRFILTSVHDGENFMFWERDLSYSLSIDV